MQHVAVPGTASMAPFLRSPDEPFPASSRASSTSAALLSHLHADPDASAAALRDGALASRPAPATGDADGVKLIAIAEAKFARHPRLAAEVVGVWEERGVGPFRMVSAPAVDGFGDPQHGWIVECGGRRILHAGDTLFHGSWWRIAHRFGSFDAAFPPIDAPVCDRLHLQPPSPAGATTTPERAAAAAHIVHATSVVPIRFGSLNAVGTDVETPHATERLTEAATAFGIHTVLEHPGDWFDL